MRPKVPDQFRDDVRVLVNLQYQGSFRRGHRHQEFVPGDALTPDFGFGFDCGFAGGQHLGKTGGVSMVGRAAVLAAAYDQRPCRVKQANIHSALAVLQMADLRRNPLLAPQRVRLVCEDLLKPSGQCLVVPPGILQSAVDDVLAGDAVLNKAGNQHRGRHREYPANHEGQALQH